MIIYGSSLSPFVRKVLVLAAEKRVSVDVRPFSPASKPPEFVEASPFGKMPALRDGDFTLADSSAIAHYIEARYPEPAMIPSEARARGRTIWFDEFADTLLTAAGAKIMFNRFVAPRVLGIEGDLAAAAKAEAEELPPLFDYLEGVIPDDNYLISGRLTLADIAVASPFATLEHVGVSVDPVRYPKLTAYLDAILQRDSFASLIAKERGVVATLVQQKQVPA
jgi:glutathione S-transferase